jgi:TatD DNase family protein
LKFIDLANKYDLPIIIHSRDALDDTLRMLKENPVKRKGVMHCYSGSSEYAKEFVKIGYYISLAGPVTFKNARVPKEVAKEVSLDNLLVETDDPYLAPHPHRGKRNEPRNVTFVIDEIARIKEVGYEEVAKRTYKNALEVFNICEE